MLNIYSTVTSPQLGVADDVTIESTGLLQVTCTGEMGALTIAGTRTLVMEEGASIIAINGVSNEYNGVFGYNMLTFSFAATATISVKWSKTTEYLSMCGIYSASTFTIAAFNGSVLIDGGTVDYSSYTTPSSGANQAYGVRAGNGLAFTSGMGGSITVFNRGRSYGAYSAMEFTIAGNITTDIYVQGLESYGIYSSRLLSAANFAGNIYVLGSENATGIYCNQGVSFAGNFTGDITVIGYCTGYVDGLPTVAYGVKASGDLIAESISSDIWATNGSTANALSASGTLSTSAGSMITISGTLGAFVLAGAGSKEAVAINYFSTLNLRVTGVLFAGIFDVSYLGNVARVQAMLDDYLTFGESSLYFDDLKNAAMNSGVYSIQNRTNTSAAKSVVELGTGAVLFGSIAFSSAGSDLTVESGVTVIGSIVGSSGIDSFTLCAGSTIYGGVDSKNSSSDTLTLKSGINNDYGIIMGAISAFNMVVSGGIWQVGTLTTGGTRNGTKNVTVQKGAELQVKVFNSQIFTGAGLLTVYGVSGNGGTVNLGGFKGSIYFATDYALTLTGTTTLELEYVGANMTGYAAGDFTVIGNLSAIALEYTQIDIGVDSYRREINQSVLVGNSYYGLVKSLSGNTLQIVVRTLSSADISDLIAPNMGEIAVSFVSGTVVGDAFFAGGTAVSGAINKVDVEIAGGDYAGKVVYGGSLIDGLAIAMDIINVTVNTANIAKRIVGGGAYIDTGSSTLVSRSVTLTINSDSTVSDTFAGWIYGGAFLGGDVTTKVQIDNNAIFVTSGVTVGNVVAGGRINNANANLIMGKCQVNIDGGTAKKAVFGGSYIVQGSGSINSSVINLNGAVLKMGLYGGGYVGEETINHGGTLAIGNSIINVVNTAISGNAIWGGSFVANSQYYGETQNIQMLLQNSSSTNTVYAGGFAVNGGSSIVYNTTVILDNFTGSSIYGGGYVYRDAASDASVGNSILHFKNNCTIRGNIYAGGRSIPASGIVTVDNSTIIFEGAINFTGLVSGNGAGGANSDSVSQSKLVFHSYDGNFNGYVDGFFNSFEFTASVGGGVNFTDSRMAIAGSGLSQVNIDSIGGNVSYQDDVFYNIFELASGAFDFDLLQLDGRQVSEAASLLEGVFALVWQIDSSSLYLAGYDCAFALRNDENYKIFSLLA